MIAPSPRASPAAGWLPPLDGRRVALVAAIGAGLAFGLGHLELISQGLAASAVGVIVGLAAALFMVREALTLRVEAAARVLGLAAAAGVLLATTWPVLATVLPGEPLFTGELPALGASLAVPAGLSGPVRLLVHTRLPDGPAALVRFRLVGTEVPVEGEVQRTVSSARVGRSMRVPVSNDFPTTWLDARLPAGGASITLDRLDGKPQEPLHVAVYPLTLTLGLFWATTAAVLLGAAVLQARAGGHAASAAGMALAFAHVVRWQATPDAPLTTTIGATALGVVLGAVAAALVTWLVGRLVRRLQPEPAASPQARRKSA